MCAHLKSKMFYNQKLPAYYFHVKTKMLADLQIRINELLIDCANIWKRLIWKGLFQYFFALN